MNHTLKYLKSFKYFKTIVYFIQKYMSDQTYYFKKKIPHKLEDVIKEIEDHDQYDGLDILIKFQYEECIEKKNNDNNKYVRSLWFHLYHGKEMPIG